MTDSAPVKLIIDTDFHSDVDDVGALAVAHHFCRTGQAELLGVTVNTPSRYGASAVRAVNAFYGRESIPVGMFHHVDSSTAWNDYARAITRRWPVVSSGPEWSGSLLRRTLAKAEPESVTIASIGLLGNLARLLASTGDDVSPLDGVTLVEQKVRRTVVMGGRFPVGREFNLASDVPSSRDVISGWPGRIEFLGWEAGSEVITGRALRSTEIESNPVAFAYEWFNGRGNGRMSWDLQTVDLAVRGPGDRYRGVAGTVTLDAEGHNEFVESPAGPHVVYVPEKSPAELATELDRFMVASWETHRR